MSAATSEAPETFAQAAAALRAAGAAGQRVRIVGGATKRRWGRSDAPYDVELHTGALDSIAGAQRGRHDRHPAGGRADWPMPRRHSRQAGQMLSLDPPLAGIASGHDAADDVQGATIGGIVATADSGPLAHRYGGPRDLVVGATVALADGTVAKSGGTVIKNVAGYDIAKLMAGSFGTLGLLLSVNVRLHPRPQRTATVAGFTDDPRTLQRAAQALATAPAELVALDVGWRDGRGRLLAQVAGPRSEPRGVRLAAELRQAELAEVELRTDGDSELWAAQRAAQRSSTQATVKVAARPSELAALLATVAALWRVAGRARRARTQLGDAGAGDDHAAALRTARGRDGHRAGSPW